MDRFNHRSIWSRKELNSFTLEDFEGRAVDASTISFLVKTGLPYSAAPFLSFDRKKLETIKEIYSTNNTDHDFLIDIGSDGEGDPICIDVQNSCKVVALDHERNFMPRLVNTSVGQLFTFLTLFKHFGDSLRQLRGNDAFINSNFTDDELKELLAQLKSVDREALANDDTFWSREIETLKVNRGDKH